LPLLTERIRLCNLKFPELQNPLILQIFELTKCTRETNNSGKVSRIDFLTSNSISQSKLPHLTNAMKARKTHFRKALLKKEKLKMKKIAEISKERRNG